MREGDIAHGVPLTPKLGQLRFDEAAEDVINDYRTNGKRSLKVLQRVFPLGCIKVHSRPATGEGAIAEWDNR